MRRLIDHFLAWEAAGAVLIFSAALLALGLANSPTAALYHALLHQEIFSLSVLHWVNDGLMAVFFLQVGLELKRELLVGELSDPRQAALPAIAAAGGVIVPALLYLWVNAAQPETLRGWAIPCATDIAFAVGVLSLLGSRVPAALKLFLLSLAVIDDLIAILIIAVFYSSGLHWEYLLGVGMVAAVLAILAVRGVRTLFPYLLLGTLLWWLVHHSGLHATLAGVILAAFIPLKGDADHSLLVRLEHALAPWVTYAIVPVFALANAGVSLAGLSLASLFLPVPLGIILGLVLGKPVGVLLATGLAMGLMGGRLPGGANWTQMLGIGLLCGVGFTMSLFIGNLAFIQAAHDYSAEVRIGILSGSLAAAAMGLALLSWSLPRRVA
jgi:NhaA family Na+:H+ antiporter